MGVQRVQDHETLFQSAGGEHLAIGGASVWYLTSANAVENILNYQPQARFIVMLRNPIEMAPALHAEMFLSAMKTCAVFVPPGTFRRCDAGAATSRHLHGRRGARSMMRYVPLARRFRDRFARFKG